MPLTTKFSTSSELQITVLLILFPRGNLCSSRESNYIFKGTTVWGGREGKKKKKVSVVKKNNKDANENKHRKTKTQ